MFWVEKSASQRAQGILEGYLESSFPGLAQQIIEDLYREGIYLVWRNSAAGKLSGSDSLVSGIDGLSGGIARRQ